MQCKLSPWKFRCNDSSNCLNSTQVCDKKIDCRDESDETGCPQHCTVCSKAMFKCHKTCQCISINFVCDNYNDCSDKSDEIGCPVKSTTTQLPTTSMTMSPTPTSHPSCPNNKIFKTCVRTCMTKCHYLLIKCKENARKCQPGCTCETGLVSNGTFCVLPTACSCYDTVLHAYKEAGERWERNCKICYCFNDSIICQDKLCPNQYCPPPKFFIKKTGMCCKECVSGTVAPTERVTTTKSTCLISEYRCNTHKCIPKEWVCDGERDCYDAEDERACSTTPKSCFKPLGMLICFILLNVSLVKKITWNVAIAGTFQHSRPNFIYLKEYHFLWSCTFFS